MPVRSVADRAPAFGIHSETAFGNDLFEVIRAARRGIEHDHVVPIGEAVLRQRGEDLSIISYGAEVHLCVEAARILEREGASVEVLDLRSLVPLDRRAILESVKKTNKALVVHEAHRTAGFGAEVAALIAEEAFAFLDGSVLRVAAMDIPVPFSPPLEMAMLPSVDKILTAGRELLRY